MKPKVIAVLAFVLTAQTAVPKDGGIRLVLDFTGDEADYAITQAGRATMIYQGMPLATGDCVSVLRRTNRAPVDNENRLVLMVDSRKLTLTKGDTPYCLKPPAGFVSRAAAIVARSFAELGAYFNDALKDYNSELTDPAISRGSRQAPIVPLAGDGKTKIVAGRRKLAIGWLGGTAPFKVSLFYGAGTRPIATVSAGESRRARFPESSLAAGRYRIDIRDAAGRRTRAPFEAIPQVDAPAEPPDEAAALRSPDTPPDVRAVVEAARLAQHVDWRLEAYQRVVDYVRESHLARAVEFELVAGS